jgi:hypothetical protein
MYMLNSWWIAAFPGLAIFVTTLAINVMGNALRDWFDPHMKLGRRSSLLRSRAIRATRHHPLTLDAPTMLALPIHSDFPKGRTRSAP